MARVKLGFRRLTTAEKILTARTVVTNMSGNPSFTTPTPDLALVTAATDGLEAAAQKAAKGGTDNTLVKNIKEDDLVALMSQLADYVQAASSGDPVVINSSGMSLKSDPTPPQLLETVQNPSAKVGGNPGEILLNWDTLTGAKSYVVEMLVTIKDGTATDPIPTPDDGTVVTKSDDATGQEWMRMDTVTRSKAKIMGLTTGTVYSFRVAGINAAGQGDYSQIASSVAP